MTRTAVLAMLTVLVVAGGTASCGKIDVGGGKQGAVRPAAPDSVRDAVELPVAPCAAPLTEEAEVLELLVARSGATWLSGSEYDPNRLKEELFKHAETRRELDHPNAPSTRVVLLRADARAAWKDVRAAIRACADPAIRIYRIYWAARGVEGGEEAAVRAFFPKDRGLARTKVKLHRKPEISVLLDAGTSGTAGARILDTSLELDDAGLEELRRRISAIHDRDAEIGGEVLPADEVPFGQVVAVLDALRSGGVEVHGDDVLRSESDPGVLARWAGGGEEGDSENRLRAALASRGERFAAALESEEGLLDDVRGVSPRAWEVLAKEENLAEAVAVLESLVVRELEHLPRVRELLVRQDPSVVELSRLLGMLRPAPGPLVTLARLYRERGGKEDLLRALTLLGLLSGDPQTRYGDRWWYCQLLVLEVYHRYGVSFEDRTAMKNLATKVRMLDDLGVLEGSPHEVEMRALWSKAR